MVVDPGLQQERTQLAWRRTLLTFAVVGLAVVRSASVASSSLALTVAGVGVVVALWLSLTTLRRGRWTSPSVREPEFLYVLRDGTMPFLITTVAVILCLAVLLLASNLV